LLHRTLQQLAQAGVQHVAIEASSHGLDQKRLDGLPFDAGAFTNLGRDHLDYHASIEEYYLAKARLFDVVLPMGTGAILNRDDARYDDLAKRCAARQV
jgi:UDP-N-acetylmuramoyl-L-alanyl-D-glutamate--2,6-diaminopimelate ligase